MKSMSNFRILIDTNIIIKREDNKETEPILQELLKILQENKNTIIVHPYSKQDIKNDTDKERRKIILSKIKSYPELESPPDYENDKEFIGKISNFENLKNNDLIDLQLFYSLYKNAINFLITEDKKIHKWSGNFKIKDCYDIKTAYEMFNNLYKESDEYNKPLSIKYKNLYNINLNDKFFDDLKSEYKDFEKWFKQKTSEGKKAYVFYNKQNSLGAFLMLKKETNERINSVPEKIDKEKILKISTLKVTETGNRIGELFLKIAFDYCIKNNFDEIYLTHFEKDDDSLIYLIEKYGFIKNENYLKHENKKEFIFLKNLKCPEKTNKEEIRKYYFPSFYDGLNTKKFIIPIQKTWHDRLFYDQRTNYNLKEFNSEFIIEGNSIQKAYLTNSKIKKINSGDILFFYLSGKSNGKSKITSIGVVDDFHCDIKNLQDVLGICKNKLVFNKKEIEDLLSKQNLSIIIFKYHFNLKRKTNLSELIKNKILKSAPQSIIEIKNTEYNKLKEFVKIPDGFIHSN